MAYFRQRRGYTLQMRSDLELLQDYVRNKSEESFAALVTRHLNLVYSAALRQVHSPQLAEEVAQSAFIDLAHQAQGLSPDTILSAWLYQVARHTAINVVRREARRQSRERVACELNTMNDTASDWTHIGALLDEAMHMLDETDRTAVLLRYFENKSLREVGEVLGATENAAQKRIGRAIERLREFFVRRGVAIGASGLGAAISANAVQVAPLGLAAAISTAALASPTTIALSATASLTKAITMTTLQKSCIAAAFVVAAGTGILFEAQKASTLETRLQTLQKLQAPLKDQIEQLRGERDETTRQLTALRADNEQLNRNASELLKLRGEVAMLRRDQAARQQAQTLPPSPAATNVGAGPLPDEIGRALGTAIVQGQPGAFGKLLDLAKEEFAGFKTNNVGLNDSQRGQLSRQTFAPLHAAFKVIEESALGGNQLAVDAVVQAMQIPELKGSAVQCLGTLAANGSDTALQVLLNPLNYGLLLSGVVPALQPAADNGSQKAIDALAAVAADPTKAPLWYLAAKGLEKSAGTGNPVAIDALVGLSASTNVSVRTIVVRGLKAAESNQSAKAAEALRAIQTE